MNKGRQPRDGNHLSAALDWLMKNTYDEQGLAFTPEALAYRVQAQGVSLAASYVSSLRTGRRDAPSAAVLHAVADVFGVPIEYFRDSEIQEAIQADGPMPAAERQHWIALMRRVARLSAVEQQELLREIERRELDS